MLNRLPIVCDLLVFQWLSLRELLATRGSSRTLRTWLGTQSTVWKSLRPSNTRLKLQLCASLPSATLICAVFAITRKDIRDWNVLRTVCAHGRLKIAQWLANSFSLDAEDARTCNNAALRYACGGGHLATAKWLTHHFGLTVEDACTVDNAALFMASDNNYASMVEWLITHFSILVRSGSRPYICPMLQDAIYCILGKQGRAHGSRKIPDEVHYE